MINILIVDDSETETKLLKHLFESEKDMHVVGCAKNGKEAVKLAAELKPNLITMDLQMPIMDGHEATRIIMSQCPTPIVVISSSLNNTLLNNTFRALEAGAISVIEKLSHFSNAQFEKDRKKMLTTIRSMAEIIVVKKRFNTKPKNSLPVSTPRLPSQKYHVVAIGSSVGGPQALKTILSKLNADFPVPIVIVQHMTQGYISGFAEWLNNQTTLNVKCVEHLELLRPGTVYFAPDHLHFSIQRVNETLTAHLFKAPPIANFCPSITALLESVAETCGKNALGILLTGMGNDGAHGLLALKKAKGHTLIQDPDSAVVFGMAGVAQSLGAVDQVIELDKMADYLMGVTQR